MQVISRNIYGVMRPQWYANDLEQIHRDAYHNCGSFIDLRNITFN